MRDYVKIPAVTILPDSVIAQREVSDEEYKNLILHYILSFYNETSSQTIINLISEKENNSSKRNKEREGLIRNYLQKWCRNNRQFNFTGFRINSESQSEGDINGHYDIQIEHSYWIDIENNICKFFVFECKCLDKRTNGQTHNVAEYVYAKHKKDGGVYRFLLDDKYATEQNFGGMIGFVLGDNTEEFKNKIKKALEELKSKDKIDFGHLTENGIIDNSIEGNDFTFDSIHTRANGKKITLHHILFDFTKDDSDTK